jgi:hypothetical protein
MLQAVAHRGKYGLSVAEAWDVDADSKYKKTHMSGTQNSEFGTFNALPGNVPKAINTKKILGGETIFRPQDLRQALSDVGWPIKTETDVVVYIAQALLHPLVTILNKAYPDFIFSYRHEESFGHDDDRRFDEDEDDVVEDDAVRDRLDCIVEATSRDDPKEIHTVLLLVYRRPGVLRKEDWMRGIEVGTGELFKNADKYHLPPNAKILFPIHPQYFSGLRWDLNGRHPIGFWGLGYVEGVLNHFICNCFFCGRRSVKISQRAFI